MGKLFICMVEVLTVAFILYVLASFAVPDPVKFIQEHDYQISRMTGR